MSNEAIARSELNGEKKAGEVGFELLRHIESAARSIMSDKEEYEKQCVTERFFVTPEQAIVLRFSSEQIECDRGSRLEVFMGSNKNEEAAQGTNDIATLIQNIESNPKVRINFGPGGTYSLEIDGEYVWSKDHPIVSLKHVEVIDVLTKIAGLIDEHAKEVVKLRIRQDAERQMEQMRSIILTTNPAASDETAPPQSLEYSPLICTER